MSIVFDAASVDQTVTGTNTGMTGNTINITSGSPLLLAGLFSSVSLSAPAVTYNGVSMTLLGSSLNYSGSSFLYVFGLLNPITNAAIAPVATWGSTTGSMALHAISYRNVSQSSLPTVTHNAAGSGTSLTGTLTTDTVPNSWVVMYARNDSNTFSAGSGSTIRSQVNGNARAWADSNGAVPISAGYAMTLSWTGTAPWGAIQLELNPSLSNGNPAFLLNFI